MFRVIFWLALIAVAVWLWRRLMHSKPAQRPSTSAADAAPMIRCACCGIHVPKTQALAADDLWYCSQQHLKQGPQER